MLTIIQIFEFKLMWTFLLPIIKNIGLNVPMFFYHCLKQNQYCFFHCFEQMINLQ